MDTKHEKNMGARTMLPPTIPFEALLDSALEHCSHAWRDLELQGLAPKTQGYWPPDIGFDQCGTVAYHLAAAIRYIQKAYFSLPQEKFVESCDTETGA